MKAKLFAVVPYVENHFVAEMDLPIICQMFMERQKKNFVNYVRKDIRVLKNALRWHISRVHEHNKVCYCYCGHSFSDNSGLKYHMNHYHQQVAKVACNECGKSLPKPSLRRHLRNIHEGKSNLQWIKLLICFHAKIFDNHFHLKAI